MGQMTNIESGEDFFSIAALKNVSIDARLHFRTQLTFMGTFLVDFDFLYSWEWSINEKYER